MIDRNIREAVLALHKAGNSNKKIANDLGISTKSVKKIIKQGVEVKAKTRCDKIEINLDELKKIYKNCDGYAFRTYEVLTEEHGIDLRYSTLTKILRDTGISRNCKKNSFQVPDCPGEEFQHDCSLYTVYIGNKKYKVICSMLYFRYSKIRYMRFYKSFNRFKMKCFFHEALTFYGYTPCRCVIDNTSLAVVGGTGKNAVFSEEMVFFSRKYGFYWLAHEKNHPNRKAGNERAFWTLETNFFPGRKFSSWDDLNRQGIEWATVRHFNRPLSGSRLIPQELFEYEKPFLIKLPDFICPPYVKHTRVIDQYGYISFDGNFYFVPDQKRGHVDIIEYADKIEIYQKGIKIADYKLPSYEIKQKKFFPPGVKAPHYQPNNIIKPADEEEKKLRAIDEVLGKYIDFIKSPSAKILHKSRYIRSLYDLSKKLTTTLLRKVIERAYQYKVSNFSIIESIVTQILHNSISINFDEPVDDNFRTRPSYQEGQFSDENELPDYDDSDKKQNNL